MNETHKLKILVCDANVRILNRLESWIEAIGENVIVSSDGVFALELFKKEKPDILLISQQLNNMGGLELLEKIKVLSPDIAVILMLGSEDTIFKQAIELQVDKYLNKPVEAKPLLYAIERLSEEKVFYKEFQHQKRVLQNYKDAIDLSFSVSRHDKYGKIVYANEMFCKTTGLDHSEIIQGVLNPFTNENSDINKIWETLEKEHIYRDRQIFILPNKKERIIDITAVTILDNHGITSEFLVFADDVTKIIHSARKIKNQELDNRLDKLNHAKELNKVKDSFLTIFTHELKTPLNSIINFSEYVVKHLKKEEFAKKERLVSQVEAINESGLFMLEMISNLMEAIKLKDKAIKLSISTFNLNNLIENLLIQTSTKRYDHNVNINVLSEINITSDELRVKQIFGNVFANALKYAQGEVHIDIKEEDETFCIAISDDGEGFKDKENVFNLFEQDDADSMTREATGTGVGLYIVKQLCDKMGYKIELLSSEAIGGAKVVISGQKDIK